MELGSDGRSVFVEHCPRLIRRRSKLTIYETDLDHIADAYRAMDERRAIKSLIRVGLP